VLPVILRDGEESRRLYLDETLAGRMPAEGTRVRVQTVSRYITGAEIPGGESGSGRAGKTVPREGRGLFRRVCSLFPAFVLWAMIAVVFGGFVFNRITDTDPAHKITIYADCKIHNAAELAEKLEKGMDGAVKMVKVHPFSFALFGSEQLKSADLYIVPDSRKNDYSEWLGEDTGKVMADPDSGISVAGEYFRYNEGEKEPSVFRLYNGLKSVHAEDGLAEKAAELLTTFGTGE
jgi:hypothetical protein